MPCSECAIPPADDQVPIGTAINDHRPRPTFATVNMVGSCSFFGRFSGSSNPVYQGKRPEDGFLLNKLEKNHFGGVRLAMN